MKKCFIIWVTITLLFIASPIMAQELGYEQGVGGPNAAFDQAASEVRLGVARGVAEETYEDTVKCTVLFDNGVWAYSIGDGHAPSLAAIGSASLIGNVNITALYDASGTCLGFKLAP